MAYCEKNGQSSNSVVQFLYFLCCMVLIAIVFYAFFNLPVDPKYIEEKFVETNGTQILNIRAATPEILENEIEARKSEWQVRERYEPVVKKSDEFWYRANLVPNPTP